jgi:dihydroflavonol-4-reductase
MKIAVTGANGHIGVNLCAQLQARGHTVKALCHKHDFGLKHIPVECHKGDLLNSDSLRSFVKDADVVIHLAAKISIRGDHDGMVKKINVDGTRNILEATRESGAKRFIHFSSIHAFEQEPFDQMLDETRPIVSNNGFAYDKSKAEGERMVLSAAGDGLDVLVLCPTAILGPTDYEPSLTGKAMLQLFRHQIPALVPGGYNWVDVRDVVDGCIASMEHGKCGEKYLLSGEWIDLKGISGIISHVTGHKTTSLVMPFWVATVGLPFITLYSKISGGDPLYTGESLYILRNGNHNIDCNKAKRELGYSPRKIEETILDLFTWFRENGFLIQTKEKEHED